MEHRDQQIMSAKGGLSARAKMVVRGLTRARSDSGESTGAFCPLAATPITARASDLSLSPCQSPQRSRSSARFRLGHHSVPYQS